MSRNSFVSFFAATAVDFLSASAASADSHEAKIGKVLPDVRVLIIQRDLIDALRASNMARGTMKQAEIDALEARWKPQRDASVRPLIDSVVENPLAARMREVIADTGSIINEIGVIDANGLSIAQSSANSDIWQGEEVKFTKTFVAGPDAVFIDEVEFDGSTQACQAKADFTVADPETGKPRSAPSPLVSTSTRWTEQAAHNQQSGAGVRQGTGTRSLRTANK